MKSIIKLYLSFILLLSLNYCFGQEPTDCLGAIIVCGNSTLSLDANGIGTQELNNSNTCFSQENNSIWLKVAIASGGTLGFTLTPNSTNILEDYDFFIFGPNASCGNIGQAIRCSTTNPAQAGLANNLTGMNSTSTDTSEGPGQFGDSFIKWLDVNAGEAYYIVIDRPVGNSPFSIEWTGTATFADKPTDQSVMNGEPLNLNSCDEVAPFDDGFTTFNLINNTNKIKGTQTDVTITYHKSISDANIGVNELKNTFSNTKNPQTIYARITSDITGCFDITEFELDVNIKPGYITPSDFILCDNLDDGNDKNGLTTFDLSSKNNEILNGQNPEGFNISYHTSQTDAENNTSPLPYIYTNITPSAEKIYVRTENKLNTNCISTTSFNLIVNPTPDAFNTTLLQCDEDGIKDGFTLFNLTEANDALSGGDLDKTVKFYTDSNRTDEAPSDSYGNVSNPQTIYVEVIDNQTGCISNVELTLNVSVTASKNTTLSTCGEDGVIDGFSNFTLTEAENDILNGLPSGLSVSYYETYEDALLKKNSLGVTFRNSTPYAQTIFARVENANECYGISEVLLKVNEIPDLNDEYLTYYCLNAFPETISINPRLPQGSENNFNYSWSTGETTYEIEVNKPGEYSVVIYSSNSCSKERIIRVEPSNIATLQSIDVVDISQNNTITVIASGEGTYEYSLLDSNNILYRPFQESNIFENIKPGIYFVQIRDIKNNCGITTGTVSVIGFPKFFTPNNDGVNDTWQVYGVSKMFQPNSLIYIYNRHGKLIKQITPGTKWDGLYNGQKLPSDDYWFSVKLQDGRVFKNHFTLKN